MILLEVGGQSCGLMNGQHAHAAIAQKVLRELKAKISSQSKKNFVLEKDVRYLDSRIALLIQNRMALEEVCTMPCISITFHSH